MQGNPGPDPTNRYCAIEATWMGTRHEETRGPIVQFIRINSLAPTKSCQDAFSCEQLQTSVVPLQDSNTLQDTLLQYRLQDDMCSLFTCQKWYIWPAITMACRGWSNSHKYDIVPHHATLEIGCLCHEGAALLSILKLKWMLRLTAWAFLWLLKITVQF